RGVGGDDVVVLVLDLHDRLGGEGGAGGRAGRLGGDDELAGGRSGDVERGREIGRASGGDGAEGRGVRGVGEAQPGEGGGGGDGGLGQCALHRAVEVGGRLCHCRGVGGDDVVVLVLDLHHRLCREGRARRRAGRLGGDDELAGGRSGDVERGR